MTTIDLDSILCLQLTVAWAGEGRCEPPRLGWWRSDLVDELGGGDLFARLLPRTHKWARLEAVREIARSVDARARKATDAPDQLLTLFHFGFALDEKLNERLAHHKRIGVDPRVALPYLPDFDAPFDRKSFASWLMSDGAADLYFVVPGGRELKSGSLSDPEALARRLAVAMAPFPDHYPMPFVRRAAVAETPVPAPSPEPAAARVTLGEVEALKELLRRDHAKRKRRGRTESATAGFCVCGHHGPSPDPEIDRACLALEKLLRQVAA